MAFDAERYRREVLQPARQRGNRPTDDLLARYQLTEPLRPKQVEAAVAAVTAFWQKERGALAFKTVIAALEAEHRALREPLRQAAEGNLGPLNAELTRRRARQRDREAALVEDLKGLAEPLMLLAPEAVDGIVAEGHDRGEVEALVREMKITVRQPDALPADPVATSRRLQADLSTLDCRHIADFLFGRDALARGFTVMNAFSVPGSAVRLDRDVVAQVARRWAARLDGKTVAEGVLTVLRRLDPEQLRQLLLSECAADLRARRDRHATTEALLKRARELGLVEDDAKRLTFAVRSEQIRRRSPLAAQLADLLEQRATVAAHRLVEEMGADLPEDCRELAVQATRLGGRAVELVRQAIAADDPDTSWRLVDEAEALASDVPDAAQLRRRWPPGPAAQARARLDDGQVAIAWRPSASRVGGVTYRVLRANRPFPPGPAGGDLVAQTPEAHAVDRTPPVNLPVYYAVVAERGQVAAAPVTAGPVWFRPEVADLQVAPGDGVVSAAWRLPAQAVAVVVRRAEGRPPNDLRDGVAVPATGGGLTDTGLRNAVAYHYLVVARYRGPDGGEVHTPGLRFTAVPMRPPAPVREIRLDRVEGEPRWLLASFEAPGSGSVEMRELAEPPDVAPGTRLGVHQLPGRPLPGVAVADGIRCRAPRTPAVLLAVTVAGQLAVIGAHAEWVPRSEPLRIRAQRQGQRIVVSCEWPADLGEVEVRWRADEGPWSRETLSAARYEADGGFVIASPAGVGTEILVAPVLRSADRRMIGTSARAWIATPVPARYTLRRTGLRTRYVVARVLADRAVHVARLVLVARDDLMPLRPADGDVVGALDDVDLGPVQPAVLRVPLPRRPGRFWMRCFAEDDAVELHDPPREQLRMR
jgi:hypothetical protein